MQYQSFLNLQKNTINDVWDEMAESLEIKGYFILENFIDMEMIEETRKRMDEVWSFQYNKYGEKLLRKVSDYGVARAMFDQDEFFFNYVENELVTNVLAQTTGETSILHLQNGILLFPDEFHNQAKYHKDFAKSFMCNEMLSVNIFYIIDDFNAETGGTWVLPGSHKISSLPSDQYIKQNKVQVTAPAGSVLVFDSLLWHCAGKNYSGKVRRAINSQYTKAFIKQQLNYPEIMKDRVNKESSLAQKLGMWAIPPKSVDEYRVTDSSLRTYRAGQG